MPTTRRAAAQTGPSKGQSTLSFHGKVTKNVTKDVKAVVSGPVTADIPRPLEEEPAKPIVVKKEAEEPEPESESEEEPEPEVEAVPEKSESELKAEKITDAQVAKYWKAIEKERISPRVHQQGLDLDEKVLRYFDVSSQYGVSIPNLEIEDPFKGRKKY